MVDRDRCNDGGGHDGGERLDRDTEIGEVATASPWTYLEVVADRYDNVRQVQFNELHFREGCPVVAEELARQMLRRGAVVVKADGGRVTFGRLDVGEVYDPVAYDRLE